MNRLIKIGFIFAAAYLVTAYWALPFVLKHYEHHPALTNTSKTTVTKIGIQGDPLNVGLIGSREELEEAFRMIGWVKADPPKIKTDIKITESTILKRPYPEAPVSTLYLWGRPQDIAFEKELEGSPRQRHHVRFWESDELGIDGRPLWIGAATLDRTIGFSHVTGEITHHIDPDIDQERDQLINDLKEAGRLDRIFQVTGIGQTWNGRNGEGDRYNTDGELTIGVVSLQNKRAVAYVASNPVQVEIKNKIWSFMRKISGLKT